MNGIPELPGQLQFAVQHRLIIRHRVSIGIRNLIDQGQVIALSGIGDGHDIAGKLGDGICVVSLSHRSTNCVIGQHMRGRLGNLDTGSGIKAVHAGVFFQLFNARIVIVFPVCGSQTPAYGIEEEVAGILDSVCQGFRSMRAGGDPAFDRWVYAVKFSRAVELFRHTEDAFGDTCRCRNRLEGGTRSQQLLRRTAVERTRQIRHKLIVIIGVHVIDQPVAVITWVGDAGLHASVIRIRNDNRAGAGHQRQLCGRDLEIVDFIPDKVIAAEGSVGESVIVGGIHLENPLVKQEQADLRTIQLMRHQHIAEHSLTEVFIRTQIVGNVICKRVIDFRGIHVVHALRDSIYINPVAGNGVSQEFLKADGLLFRPGFIGQIRLVNGFFVENACPWEHRVDNIGLIDLHLIREL